MRKFPGGVKAALTRTDPNSGRYGKNSPMGTQGAAATRPITLPNAEAFARLGSTIEDQDDERA